MEKDITFTSTIRPVKKALFDKIRITIPDNKFVDYPWTCKESVRGKSACTTNIRDCTMCGITDGQDVFMMHICPTQDANSNFLKIKDFILKRVNFKKENLRCTSYNIHFGKKRKATIYSFSFNYSASGAPTGHTA